MKTHLWIALALSALIWTTVNAQPGACKARGELDPAYCDENSDMLADLPGAGKKPGSITIGFAAVEDRASQDATYNDLLRSLSRCMKLPVNTFYATSEPLVIESLRTGRAQVALLATGGTMFAVNNAGALPFVAKGRADTGHFDSYNLLLIVRADSPYQKATDLAGKKIAHTSQTSNSGNLAPRALFPAIGLIPEKNYTVNFTGKHDKSIVSVVNGFNDAAAIASDVLERMIAKGDVKRSDFRVLYKSDPFPPDAFSMAHDLHPTVSGKLRQCFEEYRFPTDVAKYLEGNNAFFPVDYRRDWATVRQVAKAAGQATDGLAYRTLLARAGKKN